MKYGFMSFSTPQMSLAQMLDTARKYGYRGIEPRLSAEHQHGIEVSLNQAERNRIKAFVIDSGVELACLATSLKYSDPDQREAVLKETRQCLDLAGDLGAPTIRVFGGKLEGGMSRSDAIELLVESLSSVADYASERKVCICMETHDDWCNPKDVAAVMQGVDHPAVAVNWDFMHPVRMGFATISESFEILKPWIRHTHIHDNIGKDVQFAPIGTGEIDHKGALQCLISAGYDGYLSGEWINWTAPETHLPQEIAKMKEFEAQLAAE